MEGDFSLGDWLIEPQLNRITSFGQEVDLEPKVMEVLVYLAEHSGEVVPKERLLQSVWADTIVTDDVMIHPISQLRKAFGDSVEDPRVIQEIPEKGYRLLVSVSRAGEESRYRLLKRLGRGGMGEVFLAEDTVLRRKVALKFVRDGDDLNTDSEKRVMREARAAAALDHPYICHIHDVGEMDHRPFIAMEYVQGQTLKEKLSGSRLPLKEALQIALETAEALEEAHSRKIIHRDVKPGNILLTEQGHVKITDFGLAKWIKTAEGEGLDYTASVTEEVSATGTIPYMSPEQVTGKEVDPRSDIFSLGVVLYEMLTGVNPFRKPLPMETASAILTEVPEPLSTYRQGISSLLEHTVTKMLSKEAQRRYQLAREAHTDLVTVSQELLGPVSSQVIPAQSEGPRRRVSLLWAAGVIAGAMTAGAAAMWYLSPAPDRRPGTVPFRNEILAPEGERLVSYFRHAVALSADGTQVAFVSGTRSGPRYKTQIYLRRLDQWQSRAIPGTEDAGQPFFSPDGKWLGFGRVRELKKVNLSGGEPVELCECRANYGASWGREDTIIFAGQSGGLFRVSASRGKREQVTQLDEAAGEISHRLPHVLPDGKAVLFTVRYREYLTSWKRARIFVQSLDTGQRKSLLEGGSDARYVPTGHLVFARESQLLAVPFDLDRLEVTGPEVPVLEGINHSIHTPNSNLETGAAQFSFSTTGMLAYVPGSVFPEVKFTPVWVDRKGGEEPLGVEPKQYLSGRVSPDGRQVLLTTAYPPVDVWLFDLGRQTLRRQTFEGNHVWAIWGPGVERFTVVSDREGPMALYTKKVNAGPGEVERLGREGRDILFPSSWSRDGQVLIIVSALSSYGAIEGEQNSNDILIVSREGKVEPFLQTRFQESWPEFSPDGRWIVYASSESGRFEVYVRSYPGPGTSVQISTRGGTRPAWSRDGAEIFYRAGPRDGFYAVRIDVDGERLRADLPVELFEGPYGISDPVRSYDVAPDGRFLVLTPPDEAANSAFMEEFFPTRIRFVQNWFQELERLAPTGE